jgi:hypothetical protein
MHELIVQDGNFLEFCSESLKNNQELVHEAVKQNGMAL